MVSKTASFGCETAYLLCCVSNGYGDRLRGAMSGGRDSGGGRWACPGGRPVAGERLCSSGCRGLSREEKPASAGSSRAGAMFGGRAEIGPSRSPSRGGGFSVRWLFSPGSRPSVPASGRSRRGRGSPSVSPAGLSAASLRRYSLAFPRASGGSFKRSKARFKMFQFISTRFSFRFTFSTQFSFDGSIAQKYMPVNIKISEFLPGIGIICQESF